MHIAQLVIDTSTSTNPVGVLSRHKISRYMNVLIGCIKWFGTKISILTV